MLHLLKIEWLKVKNYRTFWILLLISVVSVPAFNYVIYDSLDNSFPKIQGKSILGSPFAFPDVWQTVSWNSSLLMLIPAILIITLITNEFTYKTHRQNIIDGLSRGQFINVKLIGVLILSILITLVVFLTTISFGYLANKPAPGVSIFGELRYTGFFFVQMISYGLIAFLISMLVKRAGLAMGVFFIYMIIEQFAVAFIKNMYKQEWVNFFPQEVTDNLIPQPYAQKILRSAEKASLWENQLVTFLAIAAVYIVLYCIFTNWRFRNSDL
jgi:ABC-type transport system involved in multi-copper enzyme maturation permease subunit